MNTTSITNFRKNLFSTVESTIRYNEEVTITTKNGNAVLMSEEDYRGLLETIYLQSIPGMDQKLREGLAEPISDCIPEEEAGW